MPDWLSTEQLPSWVIPDAPIGWNAWEGLLVSLALALFKIDRGRIMRRNADYIDRFGWSIILFDWAFGITFMISVIWNLYPETQSEWGTRILLTVLGCFTLWQWIEVRLADHGRIERAVAAEDDQTDPHKTPGHPEWRGAKTRPDDSIPGEFNGIDRRIRIRRKADRIKQGLE